MKTTITGDKVTVTFEIRELLQLALKETQQEPQQAPPKAAKYKSRVKLTAAIKRQVKELKTQGSSNQQIMQALNISNSSVSRILSRKHTHNMSSENRRKAAERMKALHADGKAGWPVGGA